MKIGIASLAGALSLLATPAFASGIDGAQMGIGWITPFAGLLLCVAAIPLFAPNWWHHHFSKTVAFWSFAALSAIANIFGGESAITQASHAGLDYVQFIITVGAFFIIAGGIHIKTRASGHPLENITLLVVGTILGAIVGTIGAAGIVGPVLLQSNKWRKNTVHTIVFAIILIGNIGGGLTPLGPPLVMGLLEGINPGWFLLHMAKPVLATTIMLLIMYFVLDTFWFYRKEDQSARDAHREEHTGVLFTGKVNILLLAVAVSAIVFTGSWQTDSLEIGHVKLAISDLVRMIILSAAAIASLKFTPTKERNGFSWAPLKEVAILFIGIFVTMAPVLVMLNAGMNGAFAPIIQMVTDTAGQPINVRYFVIVGILSAVLDNAPTWKLFYYVAGGNAQLLTTTLSATLVALSAGAAFWGAITYIGNATNMLIKAMAEEYGIKMPSFFGFMGWTVAILAPVFSLNAIWFFL